MTGRTLEAVADRAMEMIIQHCVRMQVEITVHNTLIPALTVYYNTKTHHVTDHKTGSKYQCVIAVCDYYWYMYHQETVENAIAEYLRDVHPENRIYNDESGVTTSIDIIRLAIKNGDINDIEWEIDFYMRNVLCKDFAYDWERPLRETIMDASEGWPTYYDEDAEHVNPAEDLEP